MSRAIFALILLFVSALPACGAIGNTSGPWGVSVSGFSNFSAALSSPLTLGKTVVVDKPVTINSKTVSGRDVHVVKGARITVNPGKTFTGLKYAEPEWFGAVGDGSTDDGPALAAAVAAAEVVHLNARTYGVSTRYALTHPDLASAGCLIPITSNRVIEGEGDLSVIKVLDGVTAGGDYVVFSRLTYTATDNITFRNFVIDGNSANNQTVAPWSGGNIRRATQILIPMGSHIRIENMFFRNNPGVWSIKLGADQHTVDITDFQILDNRFYNMGAYASAATGDHSTLYTQGDMGLIRGNRFWNDEGYDPLVNTTTALEVHGKNTTVSSNRVKNYTSLGNAVSSVWDGEHNSWLDNTGSGILRFGLGIWSWHYKTDGLTIRGNQFYMSGDVWVGGIFQQSGDFNNTEPMTNLVIEDNLVVGNSPSGTVSNAIKVSNVLSGRICNNKIEKIAGSGIVIETNTDVDTIDIIDLEISNNTITDVSYYDASQSSIFIHTAGVGNTMKNVRVVDNTMIRQNNTNNYRGIFVYNPDNDVEDLWIKGNKFYGFTSAEREFSLWADNAPGMRTDITVNPEGGSNDTGYTPYAVEMYNTGGNPALGNGELLGQYYTVGDLVYVNIVLVLGGTTDMGDPSGGGDNGALAFTLPFTSATNFVPVQGNVLGSRGGQPYFGAALIPDSQSYVIMERDTTGYITESSPVVWQTGDSFRVSLVYVRAWGE